MPALERCNIVNQHCSGLQNCSLKTANREIAVEARLPAPGKLLIPYANKST